ncbi:MAG: hypothetical protein JRJ24_07295 [Deltaproteobacteria bacterium]|nr:hypothetical protein [Deltaproteobacteria bacterium]
MRGAAQAFDERPAVAGVAPPTKALGRGCTHPVRSVSQIPLDQAPNAITRTGWNRVEMAVAELGRKLEGDCPDPGLAMALHEQRLDEPGAPTAQSLDRFQVGYVIGNRM